jgi:hypothetical protein
LKRSGRKLEGALILEAIKEEAKAIQLRDENGPKEVFLYIE